jgi:hypothetical protein
LFWNTRYYRFTRTKGKKNTGCGGWVRKQRIPCTKNWHKGIIFYFEAGVCGFGAGGRGVEGLKLTPPFFTHDSFKISFGTLGLG